MVQRLFSLESRNIRVLSAAHHSLRSMSAFSPSAFSGDDHKGFIESKDVFSEEGNYVPPPDDGESDSTEASDEED